MIKTKNKKKINKMEKMKKKNLKKVIPPQKMKMIMKKVVDLKEF